MWKNTLLLLVIVAKVTSNGVQDGIPATEGEFPHQVSLQSMVGIEPVHFCSGSILDQDWVVTSATCCQGRTATPNGM